MELDLKRLPTQRSRHRTLRDQLVVDANKPHIGVTQGGSSRKWRGARPAATYGLFKPPKPEEFGDD